jgi:hypothetical protein
MTTAEWIREALDNASRPSALYQEGVISVGTGTHSGKVLLQDLTSTGQVLFAAMRMVAKLRSPKALYDFFVLLDNLCRIAFGEGLSEVYCPRFGDRKDRRSRDNVAWPPESRWQRTSPSDTSSELNSQKA